MIFPQKRRSNARWKRCCTTRHIFAIQMCTLVSVLIVILATCRSTTIYSLSKFNQISDINTNHNEFLGDQSKTKTKKKTKKKTYQTTATAAISPDQIRDLPIKPRAFSIYPHPFPCFLDQDPMSKDEGIIFIKVHYRDQQHPHCDPPLNQPGAVTNFN